MGIKKPPIYSIGEIIPISNTNLQVLSMNNKKQYEIKCLNCGHIMIISEEYLKIKKQCVYCSKNTFIQSDDKKYWIGYTQKNEKFLFDGDDDIIKYIKSCTWRKNNKYFQNNKGEKLHRIVMKVSDPNLLVHHIGGDTSDNRISKLEISNPLLNSREKKKSNSNSSGITGLLKRGNKYVGSIKINNIAYYSKYKEKDEALIDLLIMQKHYGFTHNKALFGLIKNISQERKKEVIANIERQIAKKHNDSIKSKNTFELSDCKTFYWVYDVNGNKFKVDLNSKEKVGHGLWYVANDNYVHGSIIINGVRTSVRLHRYLHDLCNNIYKHFIVDHLNRDSLDNRMFNLIITDLQGNSTNKPRKDFSIRKDSGNYRVFIKINKKRHSRTFKNKEDAIAWSKEMQNKAMSNRLIFKSKDEVDKYLNSKQ